MGRAPLGVSVDEPPECRLRGIDVVDLTTFLERETGKVHLFHRNPPGACRAPLSMWSRAWEPFLLLAWPFMLLTPAAIKLEDGWHTVFYRQRRAPASATACSRC